MSGRDVAPGTLWDAAVDVIAHVTDLTPEPETLSTLHATLQTKNENE